MAFESNQMHLNQMQMSTIQMQVQVQMRPPRGIQMQVQMQMPHLHLQVQMHLHLNTSLITCGVIDSFTNVLTVQCDVRVSCMIISFYFRLGLPALVLT